MDIKDKLTDVEKQMFENLRIEMQVLQNLLKERDRRTGELLAATLKRLGQDPKLYGLEFNYGKNSWELRLRPEALTIAPAIPKNPERN